MNTPPHPTPPSAKAKRKPRHSGMHTQTLARAHTARAARRLRLPKDSAPSGGDKDGRSPDNLRASFPGDTHRANRGDEAGSGEAGPGRGGANSQTARRI